MKGCLDVSRENDVLLEKLMEIKATEDHVAKKSVGKTQVDVAAAAAMAAANQAALDAASASSDASDALLAAADGQQAYQGNFVSPGVIATDFQDHGKGENLFDYRDVSLGWRPYGWYTYDPTSPYTDNFDVWYDTVLERDALRAYSEVTQFNTLGYRHITSPQTGHMTSTPHIASMYVRTFTGRPCDIQMRIEEYATEAAANSGSSPVRTITSSTFALSGDSRYRLSLPFDTGTSPYLVLRIRVKRTGGIAGILSICSIYNWMLEEVVSGQTEPSKFTLPEPKRGDLSSNAIEASALEGFIWGLTLARTGTTTFDVSAGAAFVPGVDKIVPFAGSSETLAGTGAGVRYVYLESNLDGSDGTIFVQNNTAPEAPYVGTARTQVGNTMRRFIGCFIVYGSAIARFQDAGSSSSIFFTYQDDRSLRVITTTTPLTSSTISLVGYMPTFSKQAFMQARLTYQSTASTMNVGPGGTNTGGGVGVLNCTVSSNGVRQMDEGMVQTSGGTSLEISHAVTAQPVDGALSIKGFWYER